LPKYVYATCKLLLIYILQEARLDSIDLQIIKILARDSRTSFTEIASAVGIFTNATKVRINKMLSNRLIQSFGVLINPIIFAYDKECILWIKNIDKTIKEHDLFKKVTLLGDIFIYAKQLEGAAALFVLFVGPRAEDKVGILSDLLKPAKVESAFGRYKAITMKIHNSDLEIMKCLLSDARMRVEDIAKVTLLSPKTVTRRLEKMRENHILQFTIETDLTSMQLTGFIELHVLINVDASYHQNIVQRIYNEMQEYILHPPDDLVQYPINYSSSYKKEIVVASLCCANISTANLILRRLESYEGVNKVEPITITSESRVFRNWLKSEIDKRIAGSQKYSSSSATAAATATITEE
jgi:DNA-binding Lrp family transcriptional regulator